MFKHYEITLSLIGCDEDVTFVCSAYEFDECGLHVITSSRDKYGHPVSPITRKHFPHHVILEVTAKEIEVN